MECLRDPPSFPSLPSGSSPLTHPSPPLPSSIATPNWEGSMDDSDDDPPSRQVDE